MQTLKEIIVAIIQVAVFIAGLPVWLCIGAYLRLSRKDKFRSLVIFCGLGIFPAFGRWYLPFIYIC